MCLSIGIKVRDVQFELFVLFYSEGLEMEPIHHRRPYVADSSNNTHHGATRHRGPECGVGTPSLELFSFANSCRESFESERSLSLIDPRHFMSEPFRQLCRTESGVTLYHPFPHLVQTADRIPGVARLDRPLRVVFLTSIRDVGADEGVGRYCSPGDSGSFLKGTIQAVVEESVSGSLRGVVEVVGIITDDLPKDLKGSGYVASPDQDGEWIFPRDLRGPDGELVASLTRNIPSAFRELPMKDTAGRRELKFQFEQRVYEVFQSTGADVLLSDHFLARLEYLIDSRRFGLSGRVLNTHPGITRSEHPYPTCGKNPYVQMKLNALGFVLKVPGEYRRVAPHPVAGASFHFITEGIDTGPVICDAELTPISFDDRESVIVHNLYHTSKNPVCINGLRHYANTMYPWLHF